MSIKTALLFSLNIFRSKKKGKTEFRHHMLSSILGIALSLIPVIVVLEVASGMIEGITARFLEFDTFHYQARLFYDIGTREMQVIKQNIYNVPEVRNVIVERQGLGLIFSGTRKYIVNVRAVPEDLYETDPGFSQYFSLTSGTFDLEKKNAVLIGQSLAEQLDLHVGDTVKILTYINENNGEMSRVTPRPNRLTITGIYSIGYQELDKLSVFISFEHNREMLAFNQSEQYVKIKVIDPFKDFTQIKDKIRKSIENQYDVGNVISWYSMKENHYKAYETTKWLLLLIMMLIVLVAAVNISSSMVMVVMDKVQEIGILKSMGASPGTITLSFVIVGFISGFIGTVSGVLLGLLLAVNINEIIRGIEAVVNLLLTWSNQLLLPVIGRQSSEHIYLLNPEYYLEVIPIRLELLFVLIIGFSALVLAVCFAYFPARMAGRIKPLEIIRKY